MGPTWDKGAEGGRRAPRAAHPLAGGPQLRLQRAQALAQHAQLRGRDPRFRGLPVARPALLWVSIGVRARPVRAASLGAAAAVRSGPRPAAPPARPVRAAALGAAAAAPAVPYPGARPVRAAALLRAAAAPANPGISIRRASAVDLAAAATPGAAAETSVGRGRAARRGWLVRSGVGRAAGDGGRVGARQLRAQARGLVLQLALALPGALHCACAWARRLALAQASCSRPGLRWPMVHAAWAAAVQGMGASAGAAWLQDPQEDAADLCTLAWQEAFGRPSFELPPGPAPRGTERARGWRGA